jgi:hypothetical protein
MAYYRADARGLKFGDAATRTLDPLDGKEYTYATTRVDLARAIAARHADFCVYRVTLDEPIEADPGAAADNLGELFVRSPWGAVADVVDDKEGRLPNSRTTPSKVPCIFHPKRGRPCRHVVTANRVFVRCR